MNARSIACRSVAVVVLLAMVVVVGLSRAEGPNGPTPSSMPTATNSSQPPASPPDAQEVARIKQFIHATPEVRRLDVIESETEVKRLAGRYCIVKVVYAKGNHWRLYLVEPLRGNRLGYSHSEIGEAAGERGLDQCLSRLIDVQGWPQTEAEIRGLGNQCLQAVSDDYGNPVQRNADIPGYDKAPLARDLEGIIRASWTYETKGARPGEKIAHYVAYTYQRIGGEAFRHEFEFGARSLHRARTIRLATGVGDAQHLE